MNALLITAFITGFFGSLHCAGMCGPLALSFNLQGKGNAVVNGAVYNFSRIVAYFLLGTIFGAVGLSFSYAGWQQIISIIMGSVILIFIIMQFISKYNAMQIPLLVKYNNFIKHRIGHAISEKGITAIAALGFFNGLLPCGLVYLALAGAVASGNVINGGLYMALFGLGTLPLMFTFSAFGNYLGIKKRLFIRKYLPAFSATIAILLILRGLNLGIPYVSPHFETATQTMDCCTTTAAAPDASINDQCHSH